MEIRCISRDSQTIADVTPGALLCAFTPAQPDCSAADQPTANSGKSMMNASRNIGGRWCSMAILTIFTAVYGTITVDNSKTLRIRG